MTDFNPANARLTRQYLDYLKDADGLTGTTLNHTCLALAEYERFIAYRDFGKLTRKTAIAYRDALLARSAATAGSLATVHSKLMRVEKFYRWLASQTGFKKRIRYDDVRCFGLSRKDQTRARQRREVPTPTLNEVLVAIRAMPAGSDTELRDRAVMALLLLTGIRVEALISLKLKHVRADGLGINQDGAEVATKGGKSIVSFFVPVAPDIQKMFSDYIDHLRLELSWRENDPLFPKSEHTGKGTGVLEIRGLSRESWRCTDPVRRICRQAFVEVGSTMYTPHGIRRTNLRTGAGRSVTAEQFMALAQNVGHADPTTSFRSYCAVPEHRQAELIAGLVDQQPTSDLSELIPLMKLFLAKLEPSHGSNAS